MNPRFLNLGTLGLSASVAALLYLGVEHRLDVRREAAAADTVRFENQLVRERAEQTRLAVEQRRLQETEAEQQRRLEAEAAAALAAIRAPDAAAIVALRKEALLTLATLQKQQIVSAMALGGRGGAFGQERGGSLPPALAEAFGLTAEEFGALQAAVADTKSRLDELALASAAVTRPQPAVVVINVPDLPEFDGLRDRLRTAFQAALGPERFEAYETLQQGGVERVFQGLGGPRIITINRAEPGKPNRISTRTRSAGGPPDSFSGESSSANANFAEIVRQLGALAKLLPENF